MLDRDVDVDSKEDQDIYQIDPVHLDFVRQYSSLWQRVVHYDSDSLEKLPDEDKQ